MVKLGELAPSFCLPKYGGDQVCLKDLKNRWVVLYFYPKDMTQGCTLEALDFTAAKKDFEKLGAEILGISADSIESHRRFKEKNNLSITLLSDEEKKTLEAYGAWQTKKMYGREFKGIIRSTFLIDPKGIIVYFWPKVKVTNHVEEVLSKLKELSE
jgi:thioredoxin-dependent peroxiredoxin